MTSRQTAADRLKQYREDSAKEEASKRLTRESILKVLSRICQQSELGGSADEYVDFQEDEEGDKQASEAEAPGIWRVLAGRLNIDLLDNWAFRSWHSAYQRRPAATAAASIAVYVALQLFFAWAQFGMVFFVVAAFTVMFLNMGQRLEGEPSAYSVFNENCERLPGQMTAEHFERDVLQRRPPRVE